jgi:hypothetical protein
VDHASEIFCVVGTPICPHLPVPPQPSKASLKRLPVPKDQPKRPGLDWLSVGFDTTSHDLKVIQVPWIDFSSGPSRLVKTPDSGEVSDDGAYSTTYTMRLHNYSLGCTTCMFCSGSVSNTKPSY